ncbi:MAG: hypothetical protein U9P72_02180 [Campylobacterota bacterium]|nr:hypothetical protein [Campylobacterota bacterium]
MKRMSSCYCFDKHKQNAVMINMRKTDSELTQVTQSFEDFEVDKQIYMKHLGLKG